MPSGVEIKRDLMKFLCFEGFNRPAIGKKKWLGNSVELDWFPYMIYITIQFKFDCGGNLKSIIIKINSFLAPKSI